VGLPKQDLTGPGRLAAFASVESSMTLTSPPEVVISSRDRDCEGVRESEGSPYSDFATLVGASFGLCELWGDGRKAFVPVGL